MSANLASNSSRNRACGFAAMLLLALGVGCTRPNPAYRGPAEAGTPFDAPVMDMAPDTAPDTIDASSPDATDARDGTTDVPRDTIADRVDGTGDVTPDTGAMCTVATAVADCTARVGAAPCGAWTCTTAGQCLLVCPNCTDNDHDGYGVGTGCAGGDCDDTNATIHAISQRSCYSGVPAATAGVGTCRNGTQNCVNGVWMACSGQVIPTGEACNGEDDDCDGTADNHLPVTTLSCGIGGCATTNAACASGVVGACIPSAPAAHDTCDVGTPIDNDCDGQIDEECPTARDACIHVAPSGNDQNDGSTMSPKLTIGAAITAAMTTTTKTVCVAAGIDCDARVTYQVNNLRMANGVSVYGNYESTTWLQCLIEPTAPDPHVTLDLQDQLGVRFPAGNTLPTTLDGFVLLRDPNGNPPSAAAVTVDGATHVQLSNLVVSDSPAIAVTYGVNLINGAQATITNSFIAGGNGTTQSIAIRSVGSTPTVRGNCSTVDGTTGRCAKRCDDAPGLGVFGRTVSATTGTGIAVQLVNSPNALIETSTLCSDEGAQAIGVRIMATDTSNANGTVVRGNNLTANAGGTDSVGVWNEDCGEAKPWIVNNEMIQALGGLRAVGVLGVGACHPVIDSNAVISVSADGSTTEADGVLCQASAANSEASQCAVLGNRKITGSDNFQADNSAGVACRDKSCARIADNVILGNQGSTVIGLLLHNTGVTVERNRITGGCAAPNATTTANNSASGVVADDSFARLQNNVISGGSCPVASLTPSPLSIGVRVLNADDANEMDIHSNTIDGGGNAGLCNSVGIEWGVGTNTPPTAPKGIVRNNILRSGACLNPHFDFFEATLTADPRQFENNDLDPAGAPVLYANEMTTYLRDIANVNALAGASGNISANPMFVNFAADDEHLMTGSPCIGAGTTTGAPKTDFDKKPRPAPNMTKPSIGAFEPGS